MENEFTNRKGPQTCVPKIETNTCRGGKLFLLLSPCTKIYCFKNTLGFLEEKNNVKISFIFHT